MIPALETREDVGAAGAARRRRAGAEIFPHWEIVEHLGAVVPWPYPPDGAHRRVEVLVVDAHDVTAASAGMRLLRSYQHLTHHNSRHCSESGVWVPSAQRAPKGTKLGGARDVLKTQSAPLLIVILHETDG